MAVLPVPTILNILNDSNNNYMDQNVESPGRAKKRRLDHLSWEEKIQRKKLKNRVAAQTSRDRKKAKQEQMESAIQKLFNKNETLIAECERLKEANERLQTENAELNQKLQQNTQCCQCQNRTVVCASQSGSTERNGGAPSSDFGQSTTEGPSEDPSGLPSLPDLLDELESETVDLNALEQLTQTLLEDIARDLESAAQTAANQESNPKGCIPTEVVGSPSKQLEPSRTEVLNSIKSEDSVEQDISEYLLLHHNYAKKAPSKTSTKKLKTIKFRKEVVVVAPVQLTFEECSNTITLIPMETGNTLTVPATEGSLSPRSDLGYESLDSPVSSEIDGWDSSVSELFPSLF